MSPRQAAEALPHTDACADASSPEQAAEALPRADAYAYALSPKQAVEALPHADAYADASSPKWATEVLPHADACADALFPAPFFEPALPLALPALREVVVAVPMTRASSPGVPTDISDTEPPPVEPVNTWVGREDEAATHGRFWREPRCCGVASLSRGGGAPLGEGGASAATRAVAVRAGGSGLSDMVAEE